MLRQRGHCLPSASTIGRRVRIIPAFVEGASVAALALAERLEGGAL